MTALADRPRTRPRTRAALKPPRSVWISAGLFLFGGPAAAFAGGVVAAAGPPTDLSGLTGLVGVVGGILTGLFATYAKLSENRSRLDAIEAAAAVAAATASAAVARAVESDRRLDAVMAQNADQARLLAALSKGQAEVKAAVAANTATGVVLTAVAAGAGIAPGSKPEEAHQ